MRLSDDFSNAYIDNSGDPACPYYVIHFGNNKGNHLPELPYGWDKNKKIKTSISTGPAQAINYLIANYLDDWYLVGILPPVTKTSSYQLIAQVNSDYFLAFNVDITTSASTSESPDNYGHNAIEPDHYKNGDHDLLWHLKDILTPEEFRGAMKMNIIKYAVRENNKNGIEDIDKAKEYLNRFEEFEKGLNISDE
ncbi:hypothetical protein [Levilactobacillus phage ENFP1]|nr:hypothetical protein [Levilactobacillus phage ENFP1]